MLEGKPIFHVPPELKAPKGEGCQTCGIILENDCILGTFCSPECAEYEERCLFCGRGPSWCACYQDEDFIQDD